MAKIRKKAESVANISVEDAKESLKAYSEAYSQIKKIEAEIELATAKIYQKHAAKIEELNSVKDAEFKKLHIYAEANREALFTTRKSLDWQIGKIGFRIGAPTVAQIKGFKVEQSINLLRKANLPFTVSKLSIDKKAILGQRENEALMRRIADCGLEVTQKETFFVEPNETELNDN